MSDQELSEPWWDLDAETRIAEALERECRLELAPKHPLYGRIDQAVAKCQGCDDVVFRLKNDEGFAVVHLTWRQATEPPPWPTAAVFPTFAALEPVLRQHGH